MCASAAHDKSCWACGSVTPRPSGELRIAFSGAEDLVAKLFELSQAMANDWPAFRRSVEENHPPA